MGIADIIPGVSGGTIAFITGIYNRLIIGIKDVGSFILSVPKHLKKKKLFSSFFKLDFALFIPLLLGIGIAFVLGAYFLSGFIDKYPAQVYSFFIGLILSSAVLIFKKIRSHKFSEILFGFLGLLIGVAISLIPASSSGADPSLIFIFFLGMIALCAMILPGISGAYIVLMFGQLEFMYAAVVRDFLERWPYLLVFGIGGLIGLLSFSRLLSYVLKNHHSKTLYTLTGLMIGAVIGPLRTTIFSIRDSTMVVSFILFIVGVVVVFLIEKVAKK